MMPRNLTYEDAVEWVRERASECAERAEVGIWTETGRRSVLVGIARRGRCAAVIEIGREEYNGMRLMELLDALAGK